MTPRSVSDCMAGDLFRAYGASGRSQLLRGLFLDRTVRVVLTYRLVSWALKMSGPGRWPTEFIAKFVHRWAQGQAGVDFPWATQIGPALKIAHGWGLVVSAGARIGSNVTLFHGVTIGQRDKITSTGRLSSYPTIGNDVWIGAHSIIAGSVTIGNGAIVGPGTVVTRDVAPAAVVVGNPMRVVRDDCIADVLNRFDDN